MREQELIRETLLKEFADRNDELLALGITRTDSFTGEIGEFIASRYFNLSLANRSTKAYDAICSQGYKYQIKSKVISNNDFNYRISGLKCQEFDYLVIVYLDKYYIPLTILKIPSDKINAERYYINSSVVSMFSQNISHLKLLEKEQTAIRNFALNYLKLQEEGIIRSRRVVGDIGEYYAYKRLNLQLCDNKNERGLDAINQDGLTFEIKTRRVYDSERRNSETRRINNLTENKADYLVVVTLNRDFECSGMWIMPMGNIINPKSANLKIVNTTVGVKNLVPSQISWLSTGEKFISFSDMRKSRFSEVNKNCNNLSDNLKLQVVNSGDISNGEYKGMYLIILLIIGFVILCFTL